jgi:hypothetical protein
VCDGHSRITAHTACAPEGVSYRVDFSQYPGLPGPEDDKAPPVAGPFLMARPRLELGTPRFSVIRTAAGCRVFDGMLGGIR